MIPKKLQIKNFLSYGPETQTIDFLPYNLICLSGKNGHGKSALLDAITWALWGQARKTTGTSKADEGLVHLGQKHMLITFDFEINGVDYRVRREFVKTQSHPFSALDFGTIKEDGTFTTHTDKTIKATQAKLEKTIGVSYESFINSAFLRQGQANEFSKKSPKERKEILATILQLEQFENLKKIALEKNKALQHQVLQRQSIYDRITQEITQLQTTLQEKQALEEQLKEIELQEKAIICTVTAQEQQRAQLEEQLKQYEILQLHIAQINKQNADLQTQQDVIKQKHDEVQAKQGTCIDLATMQQNQQKLRILVAAHQDKLNKRLELKDQYLHLQEKKQAFEKDLQQKQAQLTQRYEINTKVIQEQIEQELRQQRKHQTHYGTLQAQYKKLTQEFTQTATQRCPMCEQNLSTNHQNIVQQKLYQQLEIEATALAVCKVKIDEAQKNLQLLHTQYQQQQVHPSDHEQQLAYQSLLKKIDVLKQTGQALAYDKQAHDQDFTQLQEIEITLLSYQTLQKEISEQEQRRQQIIDLQGHISAIKESISILENQIAPLKDCPVIMIEHKKTELATKLELQTCMDKKSTLSNQHIIMQMQEKKKISLEEELTVIEKEIGSITYEMNDFTEIIKALGKDGLQALLIEQALPEIEQEANILLAQLTDNQTQIYIESLRDLKKGGNKETLDIKISDSIGLRPYEMFSGGEAFRIDFALRIAISKLLARRAGTALQTLIIDEGFGSQDDDGLQLIMDSILKIQDNFAKVIIVSHLQSMKEQFPVHFIVEKKASGSTISVIEQG